MLLSIVTTLYRSAPHLNEFHRRMTAAAARFGDDYELIYVNDGSPDESLSLAVSLCEADSRVKVIDLSRNFGHHKAILTGLAAARGDSVFLIDCDLEEDPDLLSQFEAAACESEADVVYGVQLVRKGGWFERFSGALFYRLFNLLSTHKIPQNLLTVRWMSRRYVRSLLLHREREFVLSGLLAATGFRQVPLPVVKTSRGATTYTLARKVSSFVDAITSFSSRPLVFIFYLGVAIVSVATVAAARLIVRRLVYGELLEGWASLIVSIWLLGGLTIFCLGLIGIYLSKVYLEAKQRPITIVRRVYRHGGKHDAALDAEVRERLLVPDGSSAWSDDFGL
ncbi:MAG TPA: glycosyltransferase family 2 protein [Pirellulales bacterium]|nr:glycosyltransferase family 2 protein [Pirellulales bacterium]